MPLVAKFARCPRRSSLWPLLSSLTPGADRARVKMLRLLATGSSATRLVSKRTPTSALVVFSSGASARTSTISVIAAGLQLHVDDGVLVEGEGQPGADVPREPGQLDGQLVVADRQVEESVGPFVVGRPLFG